MTADADDTGWWEDSEYILTAPPPKVVARYRMVREPVGLRPSRFPRRPIERTPAYLHRHEGVTP